MKRRRWVLAGCLGALTLACAAGRFAAAPSHPPGRLFVSNEDSNDVSIVDLALGKVIATVPVGKRPRGMRLSPDHRTLYVAVSGSARLGPGHEQDELTRPADRSADGIVALDADTGRVLRRMRCGQDPENFDLTPDGTLLAVSNEDDAEVSLVEVRSGRLLAALPTGAEPEGVRARPDGRVIYVTSEDEGNVSVLDVASRKVVATFEVGKRPRSVAFSSDSRLAFVTAEQGKTVAFVDAQNHHVLEQVSLDGAQTKPMGIVVTRDDRTLYVTTGRGGSVVALDVATRKVVRTFADVGTRPWGLALSADGRFLYTANGPSNDVSVVDTRTGGPVRHIPVGGRPWGVVLRE